MACCGFGDPAPRRSASASSAIASASANAAAVKSVKPPAKDVVG